MPQTDSYGRHEVLHVASILADNFESYIVDHEAVSSDAELQAAAQLVMDALAGFYQLVGRVNDDHDSGGRGGSDGNS